MDLHDSKPVEAHTLDEFMEGPFLQWVSFKQLSQSHFLQLKFYSNSAEFTQELNLRDLFSFVCFPP
jgi:hypothetical protein